jgi:hypothetical protein
MDHERLILNEIKLLMFDVTSKEGLGKRSIKVVKVEKERNDQTKIDYHNVEMQLLVL